MFWAVAGLVMMIAGAVHGSRTWGERIGMSLMVVLGAGAVFFLLAFVGFFSAGAEGGR
jgi:hypothetical protein